MLIKVKVIPNSKKENIIKRADDAFTVSVKEKAEGGQANKGVVLALAEYFEIPASKFRMIKGAKQRSKIFEISVDDSLL